LGVLAQLKKVLITVPPLLLGEADSFAKAEGMNRSQMIREAMRMYIRDRGRASLRKRLENGYRQMASLSRVIAEEFSEADAEALTLYEEKLAECE
jgi:CopG family transcriptional regulator/antitoxin EndoAI